MERGRVWEIDFLRALAIILMVVFHMVYDFAEYLNADINYFSGFWFWVGKSAALIFIFISGISSGFSSRILKRGGLVLGMGLGISAATYLLLGDMYIRFGILHFLGTCMLLYPLLNRLNIWVLTILAGTVALISRYVHNLTVKTGLLLPLGLRYRGFSSVDYYPLIPYLAVFLLGIIAFKLYYKKKRSLFRFRVDNRFIVTLSKNSLWIYVAHQPVLLGLILLYKYLIK